MSEVKWIKIAADIFDNRKIKQIETLPKGDSIIIIWFKLLCLAGNINDNGSVYLTKEIPYTEQMLASQFNRPIAIVQVSLRTFEQFGMIETSSGFLKISNWGKYQNTSKLSEIREYNRLAQKRCREKSREVKPEKSQNVNDNVNDMSMTCQPCQDADIEEDKKRYFSEEEFKEEKNGSSSSSQEEQDCPFSEIKDLYHKICVSFPKIIDIDEKRREAIAAQWEKNRSLDTFEKLFRIAEDTPFLKGKNERNWRADFDWMMKPENFLRILEHKYDNKAAAEDDPHGGTHPGSFDTDEFFAAALNQNTKGETK